MTTQQTKWLRIAVSVFFGVLTVALCVLWVWSKWRLYELNFGLCGYTAGIAAADGVFGIGYYPGDSPLVLHKAHLSDQVKERMAEVAPLGFALSLSPKKVGVNLPIWLLVLLSGSIVVVVYVRQFSLRTLLIATTLVAIVLGLAVWASR